MRDWPHPESSEVDDQLRYLLGIEPDRILSFLAQDEPGDDGESLLKITMGMRELSRGMRLTAASAWFRFHPERWQAHADAQPEVSEGSMSSMDFVSASTATGGSSVSLRALQVGSTHLGSSVTTVDASRSHPQSTDAELKEPEADEVQWEVEIPSMDTWPEVVEEFRDMHHRVCQFFCEARRDRLHMPQWKEVSTPKSLAC